MTKPAITSRQTKGIALTYAELDTNFANLRDSTIGITAGSGGTQVTSDLNGNITLVAGTNVTLSGDNTAKTVTINATSGTENQVDYTQVDSTTGLTTFGKTSNSYDYIQSDSIDMMLRNANSGNSSYIEFNSGSGSTANSLTLNVPSGFSGLSAYLDLSAGSNSSSSGYGFIRAFSPLTLHQWTSSQYTNGQDGGTLIWDADNYVVKYYDDNPASPGWKAVSSTSSYSANSLTGTTLASNVVTSSLTQVGTLTAVNTSGTITSTATANTAVIDKSNSTSYADSATVDFANFSGMVTVNSYATGNIALWLCGGGSATKLGDSLSNTSGVITYVSGINGYRWTNNTGGTITASLAIIRTRQAS